MQKIISSLCALMLIALPFDSAQAQDGQATGPHQIGAFFGRVLPNGVTTDDEIFGLSGLRYSIPSGPSSYYDLGVLLGNSEGIKWQGAFASLRMDIPVETLVAHAGVGVDFTRLEEQEADAENEFGVHFIGGLMSRIGGNSIFRFDMKVNSRPGTSLFFGLGIVLEL